ncbi:MAG TPA: hypothetical protein VGQ62_00930 [Chloroflexota bacterium]|nr:hypothetical protein [Chloroflexota bacterium]
MPTRGLNAGGTVLPPNNDPTDPRGGYRSDLPPLVSERRPHGYRPGWQLEERFQGLGVVVLGLVGLLVAYGIYTGFLPAGLPPPPQPSGVLVAVPTFNAISCVLPLLLIGSVALVLVGFRQFLDP